MSGKSSADRGTPLIEPAARLRQPGPPRAVVLTHVAFEDAGNLEQELLRFGFQVQVVDACTADLLEHERQPVQLLVVMGGPIAAYRTGAYPFLQHEIAWIGRRLQAGLPTLGVCLGAQLMAAALGARVYPGERGGEIGWAPIEGVGPLGEHAWLANLLQPGVRSRRCARRRSCTHRALPAPPRTPGSRCSA